jgi:hypothetical protein
LRIHHEYLCTAGQIERFDSLDLAGRKYREIDKRIGCVEPIVSQPAGEAILPTSRIDKDVISEPAGERVGTSLAAQRVVSIATVERITVGTTQQFVVSIAADERISARPAIE